MFDLVPFVILAIAVLCWLSCIFILRRCEALNKSTKANLAEARSILAEVNRRPVPAPDSSSPSSLEQGA